MHYYCWCGYYQMCNRIFVLTSERFYLNQNKIKYNHTWYILTQTNFIHIKHTLHNNVVHWRLPLMITFPHFHILFFKKTQNTNPFLISVRVPYAISSFDTLLLYNYYFFFSFQFDSTISMPIPSCLSSNIIYF